jgi:hypothetical protein
VDPAPIRLPFRVFAGAFALVAALVCALAFAQQFIGGSQRIGDRLWLALLALVFGFAARYFGYFAFTGVAPPRPARRSWRVAFDILFGIGVTVVILVAIRALIRLRGSSVGELAWSITLVLAFLRAARWYWEHGAASVRRRVNDR